MILSSDDSHLVSINEMHCFGHSGVSVGVTGDLKIRPAPGHVVIVLADMNSPVAG